MTKHDERLLDGEEDEEYLEDYHYQDWGVDRVDLDFKSGNINDSRDGDGECITWHLPPKLPWLSGKYKVVSIKFKHQHYSKEHFHSSMRKSKKMSLLSND